MRDLLCPRCAKGRFRYADAKKDSAGAVSVKIRVCPACGLERIDTHSVEYRESGPAHRPEYLGEGGISATFLN